MKTENQMKDLVEEITETLIPLIDQAESPDHFGVALLAAYIAFAMAVLQRPQAEAIDFTIAYLRDFKSAGLNVMDVKGRA